MIECIILIVDIALLIMLVLIYKELLNKQTPVETKPTEYTMTDEDKEDFLKADAEATKSFYSALANLNSFMTGADYGEEIRNVGQQDQ